MMATNSPGEILRETSRNAWTATSPIWYVLLMLLNSITSPLPAPAPGAEGTAAPGLFRGLVGLEVDDDPVVNAQPGEDLNPAPVRDAELDILPAGLLSFSLADQDKGLPLFSFERLHRNGEDPLPFLLDDLHVGAHPRAEGRRDLLRENIDLVDGDVADRFGLVGDVIDRGPDLGLRVGVQGDHRLLTYPDPSDIRLIDLGLHNQAVGEDQDRRARGYGLAGLDLPYDDLPSMGEMIGVAL